MSRLMGELTGIALWALAVSVGIAIGGNILRRLGYSWWYGALLGCPFVNLVVTIVIAAKQWPIERECALLRLIAGESTDVDADVESVVSHAIASEQSGKWDRAASLYRLAASKSENPQVKQYIAECVQRLAGTR
jgi:hypothetical protein